MDQTRGVVGGLEYGVWKHRHQLIPHPKPDGDFHDDEGSPYSFSREESKSHKRCPRNGTRAQSILSLSVGASRIRCHRTWGRGLTLTEIRRACDGWGHPTSSPVRIAQWRPLRINSYTSSLVLPAWQWTKKKNLIEQQAKSLPGKKKCIAQFAE